MKFYIVGPGKDGEGTSGGIYTLITEKGQGLASHLCSAECYAYNDLEGRRPDRKHDWKERFGEYEMVLLRESEMDIETLIKLNKKFNEKETKE